MVVDIFMLTSCVQDPKVRCRGMSKNLLRVVGTTNRVDPKVCTSKNLLKETCRSQRKPSKRGREDLCVHA